jgi:peroxiredoxin
MKNHSIAVVIMMLPMLAMTQTKKFTVSGKIGEMGPPAKAFIFYESGGVQFRDSALLKKGVFLFKGNIDRPFKGTFLLDEQGAGIDRTGPDHRFTLYVEPGVIKIESPDSANHIKIIGTPLNADCQTLKETLKPVADKIAATRQPGGGNDTAARRLLLQQRSEVIKQFIKDHPASLVSFDALKEYGGMLPDPFRVEPVYDYLSEALKANTAVKEYYNMLQNLKRTAIGQAAPDFTQTDTAGAKVSLHNFKGKYVLLDFWASWCKPCRHENPAVVNAFHKYKDKDFTIVSVSLDAPGAKDKWLKAIHEDGLTGWTHVSDLNFWSNEVAKLYSIQSIPQNFLLDKEGKIIAKNLRGEELEAKLHEVLGNSN